MQEYVIKVEDVDAGKRLDLFLVDFVRRTGLGFSRRFIQTLIKEGKVSSQALSSLSPHYKVKRGQELKIRIDDSKKDKGILPEEIPLEIIYEDDDLAIINKPTGLVVHPGAGNLRHTLVNALLYHFKSLSDINPDRPGIVHRLDKDTSGIMVIAKTNYAHLELVQQFAKHSIKRTYIAIVKGRMEFEEGFIELPIGRHPRRRKSMCVGFDTRSRYAKTYYRTLKRLDNFSLLELKPYTGRTHQLRVHLAFLGHPILGDVTYGKNKDFIRLALHAKSIGFTHPRTKQFIEFHCDIPKEFINFLRTS
ncbi:MAG: RluA family pseudouridine synthase [Candidatus Omnitrophica bacterium]|nr:RluA family pseudouridine synthase [Candidatus Omnitrophota bacterium]